MRSFHIRESGRGEERILLRYRYEALRAKKQFCPFRKKENTKVNCVILRWAYRDYPAKNLKSYFRAEILRKSVKVDRLRMTIGGFVQRFFARRSKKQVSE